MWIGWVCATALGSMDGTCGEGRRLVAEEMLSSRVSRGETDKTASAVTCVAGDVRSRVILV